jgi:hypothetical protein
MCIAIVVLLAIIATAIAVPLTILKNTSSIPEPYIEDFNAVSDKYIKVQWKEVSKASSYNVQYCYGNVVSNADSIVSAKTTGLYYTIERQKGVLAYRVRINTEEGVNGDYSEWQYIDIPALELESPSSITFNDDGLISWTKVQYYDIDVLKYVPYYVIDFTLSGDLLDSDWTSSGTKTSANSLDISTFVSSLIIYTDEWSDVTLTVKIKCLNYEWFNGIKITDGYDFLYNAYDESEYTEKEFIIDETKYKEIIN